jgi:hypothetical protein
MYYNTPYIAPDSRRWLVPRHLDLLGAALERLCGQTRAEFARTLAELAASFVCEAVSTALAAPDYRAQRDPWPRRDRRGSILNVFDDPAAEYDDDLADGWEEEHYAPSHSASDRPLLSGEETVPAALALGLRMTAWWLCRRPGRLPLLSAMTLGAASTMVAVAGGPLVLAGLGLAEAILSIATAEGAGRLAARLLVPSRN